MSFATGTLGYALSTAIDSLLATAAAPPASLPIYSDVTTGALNASRWIAGIDLSPFAMSYDDGSPGLSWGLTAVHASIGMSNVHIGNKAGSTVYFRGTDGTVYSRRLGTYTPVVGSDTVLYRFFTPDGVTPSPLPSQVSIAPTIDPSWNAKFTRQSGEPPVPLVRIDRLRRASVLDCPTQYLPTAYIAYNAPTEGNRPTFTLPVVNYDSGGPFFFLLGTQPVLVTTAQTTGFGPGLIANRLKINQAMGDMVSGSRLSIVDVSSYSDAVEPGPGDQSIGNAVVKTLLDLDPTVAGNWSPSGLPGTSDALVVDTNAIGGAPSGFSSPQSFAGLTYIGNDDDFGGVDWSNVTVNGPISVAGSNSVTGQISLKAGTGRVTIKNGGALTVSVTGTVDSGAGPVSTSSQRGGVGVMGI